ncbi:MAG: hypothetical protein RL326_1221 [Pseudomonadota bacterium]
MSRLSAARHNLLVSEFHDPQHQATTSVDSLQIRPYEQREMLQRLEDTWNDLAASSLDTRALLHKYLGLGSQLLRNDPSLFERTVEQLFEAASYMPEQAAQIFREERVSSQTFAFQDRFRELVGPTDIDLSSDFAFHINTTSLLLSIPNRTLIPPRIREPRHIDNGFDAFNRNHVFFATDKIDPLSVFLVGHAFFRAPSTVGSWPQPEGALWNMNLAEAWACEPTAQCFSSEFMLAVISPNYSNPKVERDSHDIESPVRAVSGSANLVKVSEPIQVDLIKIPTTVLLPSQRAEFERESSRFAADTAANYNVGKKPFEFPKQFVVTRHAELALKLALLELWEAKFASKAGHRSHTPRDLQI